MLHNGQFHKVGYAKRLTTRIAGRSTGEPSNPVIPLYESPKVRPQIGKRTNLNASRRSRRHRLD